MRPIISIVAVGLLVALSRVVYAYDGRAGQLWMIGAIGLIGMLAWMLTRALERRVGQQPDGGDDRDHQPRG